MTEKEPEAPMSPEPRTKARKTTENIKDEGNNKGKNKVENGKSADSCMQMNFGDFVLQQFDGSADDAVAAYEAHSQKMTEKEPEAPMSPEPRTKARKTPEDIKDEGNNKGKVENGKTMEKSADSCMKMNFRDFVLQQFDGSADDAVAAYEAYCQKMTEKEPEAPMSPEPCKKAQKTPEDIKDEGKNKGKNKVDKGKTEEKSADSCMKMNFRDFVLQQFDGSADDAVAAYEAYCQKMTEREFEILKRTGLCFDLYHPVAQLRSYEWGRIKACERAKSFLMDLECGKYTGLSLQARRPSQMTGSGSIKMGPAVLSCPVAGHLQPPEFAFDANVGTLMIDGLPATVSAWDVVEALQDFSGFTTAAWSPPSQKLSRTFYAHFSSAEEAYAALFAHDASFRSKGLNIGTARVSLQEASPKLSALVLPPEMSSPRRLERDLVLSKEAPCNKYKKL